MKKMIRNSMNFSRTDSDGEKIKGVTVTLPDESLSIRTIVDKYTRSGGVVSGIAQKPGADGPAEQDHDSEDLEKLKNEDLYDQEVYRRELAAKMLRQEEALKKQAATAAAKTKAEADELAELKAELKARKQAKSQSKGAQKSSEDVTTGEDE